MTVDMRDILTQKTDMWIDVNQFIKPKSATNYQII